MTRRPSSHTYVPTDSWTTHFLAVFDSQEDSPEEWAVWRWPWGTVRPTRNHECTSRTKPPEAGTRPDTDLCHLRHEKTTTVTLSSDHNHHIHPHLQNTHTYPHIHPIVAVASSHRLNTLSPVLLSSNHLRGGGGGRGREGRKKNYII